LYTEKQNTIWSNAEVTFGDGLAQDVRYVFRNLKVRPDLFAFVGFRRGGRVREGWRQDTEFL